MLCPKSPVKTLFAVSVLHIKSHMPQSKSFDNREGLSQALSQAVLSEGS